MTNIGIASSDMAASAQVGRNASSDLKVHWHHYFEVVCRDADGNVKWVDGGKNLITTEGLNDMGDKYYKGSAYTAAFYVGLLGDETGIAAGDTLASHAGWVEFTSYTGNRQTLTLGSFSAGSANNTGNEAVFSCTGSGTVGGCFVCTVNTGTAGVLTGEVAFTGGDKTVANTDTLTVTVTVSFASA